MKKELTTIIKSAIGFAWMIIVFWSCSDDPGKVGLDLLPVGDLVGVSNLTETNIKAYAVTDGNQRTDEPARNLLGTLNDPVFGKTTADFAIQLRLLSFPKFTKDDVFDSLIYYVAYKEIYGDTLTPQKLRVYELASDLDQDLKYYQDVNLKSLANSEVLAELDYIPKFELDSLTNKYGSTKEDPKDTVSQEIAFHLSETFAQRLIALDSVILSDNDLFIKEFKGLYIEAGDLSSGGTVVRGTGSGMVLYTHNAKDTIETTFYVTKSSARVNRIAHDYSNTAFFSSLNAEVNQENLIYVQPTGGLRTKIVIPNLGYWSKMNPDLANNSDTTKLIINKAELVFTIVPEYVDTVKFPLPERLLLAGIGPGKSKVYPDQDSIYYLSDYNFSPAYFGGFYDKTDKTYRFNIAKHMDDLLEPDEKKRKQNLGFYLEALNKNSTLNRVVLTGTKDIRLEITYSKLN